MPFTLTILFCPSRARDAPVRWLAGMLAQQGCSGKRTDQGPPSTDFASVDSPEGYAYLAARCCPVV